MTNQNSHGARLEIKMLHFFQVIDADFKYLQNT
jgi:hypothetical protein